MSRLTASALVGQFAAALDSVGRSYYCPGMLERHYTPQQLADLFALNVETIRREAARGHLRFMRVGKDLRFAESAVKEWCESKQVRAA
jgi:excisionase family DNA binding protein